MLFVAADLGFSKLVLVACVVFPVVIGLLIRRRRRLSVARQQEIRRLLLLASEESARAEREAYSFSYGPAAPVLTVVSPEAVSGPRSGGVHRCAVCFSPTTTRCARCKSVRYCSGKCQIIHWWQGHKDECHPPNTAFYTNSDVNDSVQKFSKIHQDDIYKDRLENAINGTTPTESVVFDSDCYTEVPKLKDNSGEADSVGNAETAHSASDSPDASFSEFSNSSSSNESLDDASVSESITSDESDGSGRQNSSDVGPKVLASSLHDLDHARLSSPKFASLVDRVDGFIGLNQPNLTKWQSDCGKSSDASASSSDQGTSAVHEPITAPDKISRDFWQRTLDCDDAFLDSQDDSSLHRFSGAGGVKRSDSELATSSETNSYGKSFFSLDRKNLEVKSIMSDDLPTVAVSCSIPSEGPTLSSASSNSVAIESPGIGGDILRRDADKAKCIAPKRSEGLNYSDGYARSDSKFSETNNVRSAAPSSSYATSSSDGGLDTDASNLCRSLPPSSEKSDFGAACLSKSSSPSCLSQIHMPYAIPSDKVDNVKSGDTVSQLASFHASPVNGLESSVRKAVEQLKGPRSGRSTEKGLFAYDLFVKLYTSNRFETQPFGLNNCGNSCYANAVLQCLAFTPPLTAYFCEGLHSKACKTKEWCFSCEFENLMLKAKEGKSPLSPSAILSHLNKIGSQLGNGREEDAHEFLRYAIDAMQSICLKEAGINASSSFKEETTLMGLTFGGYLRSRIKCMKCQYKSERQERMMDLTVEIEGDIGKLEDALKRFTCTEVMDGENKYQCSRCKSYERAKKKLKILEAPNILTIALKRFQSGKFGKLNKSIQFPEILDLAPYMSGTGDTTPIYRLYGVVVHLDIMNAAFSGHYVCYIRNIRNKWFKVDDSSVSAVVVERVLSKEAYMLFYARCSPRAPRILRNIIIPQDTKIKSSTPRINIKNGATLNLRSISTQSSVFQVKPSTVSPDNAAGVESFYLRFHRVQRMLAEDSWSDSYSFTSSNSEEGSCSTDSNRDSTSTEDLSDYIFGDWNSNSPWRSALDSDASSSTSSPSYWSLSPLSVMDQNSS